MKPLGFIYEHNKDGRLVHLHTDDWVPGMSNRDGKMFILKDDPRKINIPEDKISLAAPQKPKGAARITSKRISSNPTARQKAKKRYKCKKGRKFSDEQVLSSIAKGSRKQMKIGKNGNKQWWIMRPRIEKQLRGFSKFDKGSEFQMFYLEQDTGKLYVWTKPGVTINSSVDTADFLITFNVRPDSPKGK